MLAFDDRRTIRRQGVESGELRFLPVATAQDYRHHARLPCVVHADRLGQLHIVAVIRMEEVGADEQQDDVGIAERLVNGARPFARAGDLAVVPDLDQPLALQRAQVLAKGLPMRLVLVRIGDEDLERLTHGLGTRVKELRSVLDRPRLATRTS